MFSSGWTFSKPVRKLMITNSALLSNYHLWVPTALLGSVEHLKRRLRQGLALVQDGHLLLMVVQL